MSVTETYQSIHAERQSLAVCVPAQAVLVFCLWFAIQAIDLRAQPTGRQTPFPGGPGESVIADLEYQNSVSCSASEEGTIGREG